MGAAVPIRTDIAAAALRRLARRESDGRVAARLLGLANVLDGMSREAAARAAGLHDQPQPGRPPRLTAGPQAAFKAVVLRGPDPERDGVSAWRIADLCRLAEERFGVTYREGGMLRLVKAPNLSWQKVRPSHPKADRAAQARFKGGPCGGAERHRPRPSRCRGATLVPR